MQLQGKTLIVTGGNSGIGEAIVLAAAAEGANVVIDYLVDPDDIADVVEKARQAGGQAVGQQADVSNVDDLHRLIQRAVSEYGRLDVMVNNAGMETRKSLLESSVEDFEKVVGVDLKSAYFGTQLAAKQFIEQGGGGVVLCISSVHEDRPMPGNMAYCVAKGGERMLTRTAGVELAQYGIRCVNVAPGAVSTPINARTEADPAALKVLDSAIPLGRIATPAQIADVVVFLASERAGYITATTVLVDGGMTQASTGL